jgi:iron-sulfur cluster assembly accessory protein
MKDKAAFTLSDMAIHRVKLLLDNHNNGPEGQKGAKAIGIRIGVKKRGCSGYSYTVNYAFDKDPNIKPQDTHVDQGGVHVYVDHSALFYVIGTSMNYISTNVEEKFTFQNPNKIHSCGCDESFMVDGAR